MTPESLWIEGYADRTSLLPGERVGLHVSTSAPKYSVEVSRIGATREVVFSAFDLPGAERRVPPDASSHGCRWPVSHELTIPAEWRSGYYQVDLKCRARGGDFTRRCERNATASLFLVVRAASNSAPGIAAETTGGAPGHEAVAGDGGGTDRPVRRILLQLATNTWCAYTNWGGYSLYGYHAIDGKQGRRVSFDRPIDSQFGAWEAKFVAWAERAGYELDYAANLDLEEIPGLLDPYGLVLSVGHDEYWTSGMRDALEGFVARGGNAAFFSGNTCCWQVRRAAEGRELIGCKQAVREDHLHGRGSDHLLSTLWSHHLVGRPENRMTGVGFLWGGYHRSHEQFMDGSGAFTVHRPDHWVFEGTGLARGDAFGGKDTVVGYECDGCETRVGPDGLPEPTGSDGTPSDFTILANAPAKWHPDDCEWYERWEKGRVGSATMGVHSGGGAWKGTVFTAGTTDWAHGLAGGDPVVERITRNVLDRLGR